ncbi:TniQ family protein [Pseudoxanthomonas kaohsiungensis]|uniref:TniQ family protein n=1 Tax=Pseudoxanthomonas kaohsiungensis TaxID=283923 RepID=UPI0035B4B716
MPEEPARGHLHRIAALNNCRRVAYLLPLSASKPRPYGLTLDDRRYGGWLLRMLASAAGKSWSAYVADHSMAALLLHCHAVYMPMYWENIWRRGLHEHAQILEPRKRARLCPACREEDMQKKGFFWYRRAHQFAGMEWCPFHGAKLVERILDHSDVFAGFTDIRGDADGARSGVRTTLEAAPPVVRAYTALISWMFEGDPSDRRHFVHCLFDNHRKGFSGTSTDLALARIGALVEDAEAKLWFQANFQGLKADGWRWVPENSFYLSALTVASYAGAPDELVQRLNDEVAARNAAIDRFLGRARSSENSG